MREPQTTHTPGPWLWDEDALYNHEAWAAYKAWRDDPRGLDWLAPLDVPDAIVETDSGYYGPRNADRHLIAAAPELLAALEKCVAMLQHVAKAQPDVWFGFDCLNDALAALAKADPNNYPTSDKE